MARKKTTTSAKPGPLLAPGNIVLIRTAVYHALGRVAAIYKVVGVAFVQLHEAAFLGDTGRYHEATEKSLAEVAQAEIEPVGLGGRLDVQVSAICDVALALTVVRTVR